MADSAPVYSIVSWVRRGLANFVTGQPATNYAALPVSVSVNGTPMDGPAIRLLGPGDITGLDARAVIRTDPRDNNDSFEPNYLAIAELAMPDLPWMFTPCGNAAGRLQPWMCLIVVPDAPGAEIQVQGGGVKILRMDAPLDPKSELPDLKTIDFWAHAQVTGAAVSGEALQTAVDGDPTATLARLISSRKLEPDKGYIGCIVPTFHAGVNAALGLTVDEHDLAPAWDSSVTAPFVLPVYYTFRFRTGPGGDFGSLAKRIMPPAVKLIAGTRTMDVSSPGFGAAPLPLHSTMELEGALRTYVGPATVHLPAPSAEQTTYELELSKALLPISGATGVPILAPPTYGSSQAGVSLPAAGAPPVWLGELNLDPRTRVSAAAGTQVVKKNQEALVTSSWIQVGELTKANRLLRQAQLARQVSASLSNRHLQRVTGEGVFLQMTAPLHSRVTLSATSATLRGNIESSRLPLSAASAAMRKLARPRGPIGRQVATVTPYIVERLNLETNAKGALQIAPPVAPPRGMIALDAVASKIPGTPMVDIQVGKMARAPIKTAGGWKLSSTGEGDHKPIATSEAATTTTAPLVDWSTNQNLPEILKGARPNLPAPVVFPSSVSDLTVVQEQFRTAAAAVSVYLQVETPATVDPAPLGGTATSALLSIRRQLQSRLDPEKTIQTRVRSLIPLGLGPDPLQPVRTGPQFPQPMYTTLADLSPEWMLPGISTIPIDCAALLAPNAKFIESFMIGLNEELSRELLWRQFPADPQTTYFQNFWGAAPDIPQIRTFDGNGSLGSHLSSQSSGDSIVLLIRASLFLRYPNAVVSAVQAQWVDKPDGSGKIRVLTETITAATHQYPVFRGEIGSDVTFFGFEIADPRGTPDPAANRPGWYFVIEEHLTEPRFGLEPNDVAETGAPSWNDLSWQDLTPALFLDPTVPPKVAPQRELVPWGQDAASMAFILMRKPIRVALHALALLGPEDHNPPDKGQARS